MLKPLLIISSLIFLVSCANEDGQQGTVLYGSIEQPQQQSATPEAGNSRAVDPDLDSSDQPSVTPSAASEGENNKTALQIVTESEFAKPVDNADSSVSPEHTPFCLNPSIENNAAEVDIMCDRLSKRLASVTRKMCDAAKLESTGCYSVLENPILTRVYGPVEGTNPKGKVLIIGGTHADELTSVSIVFRWMQILNKYHSGLYHWRVTPLMNPDGLFRRGATRTNENGVDLNRNLPSDDWYENALKYWRVRTGENPRRYPGVEPGSEPETKWLIDEIESFKPDAIISVHAPHGVVDYDARLFNKAPRKLGAIRLNLLGTYPGSLGNYAGINRNIPVITLELPHAWVMPSEEETRLIWQDLIDWLQKNINPEELAKR